MAKKKNVTLNTNVQNNSIYAQPVKNILRVSLGDNILFSINNDDDIPKVSFYSNNKKILEILNEKIVWYSGDTEIVIDNEKDLSLSLNYVLSTLNGNITTPSIVSNKLREDAKKDALDEIIKDLGVDGNRLLKIFKLRKK